MPHSLDPDNWDDFRQQFHDLADELTDYLIAQQEGGGPGWMPVPDETKSFFRQAPPAEAENLDTVLQEVRDHVLPYSIRCTHPRHWGWVNGTGTPAGILGALVAATMNVNALSFDQSSTYMERQLIDWMKQGFGFPAEASGVTVSSCSIANLVCLAAARNSLAEHDVRSHGALQENSPRLKVYYSDQTHYSVGKAIELTGLGQKSIAIIPSEQSGAIDLENLQARIRNDRKRGEKPAIIVANLCTVGTGAVDNLSRLADLAGEENLWLHVDGAFGALLAFADKYRHFTDGLDRADSVAFDFHKWFSVPYDAAAAIVRDGSRLEEAFSTQAAYTAVEPGGVSDSGYIASNLGPELSRGFRALKIWMSLKACGLDRLGALADRNIDDIAYLKDLVEAEEKLELLAPVATNILVFRYCPRGLSGDALNQFNKKLLVAIQRSGLAVPSGISLDERFGIRIANVNHRTRRQDFDLFVQEVPKIAKGLAGDPDRNAP